MPKKKKHAGSREEPPREIILEEIRSQNRATIEAVEANRAALEQRIGRLEHDTRTRDAALEMAIRELRVEVRQLQGDLRQVQGDVRDLTARVTALSRLEDRVAAFEKRLA